MNFRLQFRTFLALALPTLVAGCFIDDEFFDPTQGSGPSYVVPTPDIQREECRYDDECFNGEFCDNGYCAIFVGCYTDWDCGAGESCGSDGYCYRDAECLYDWECPSAEYCEVDGICYPDSWCLVDADCPRDTFCAADHTCEAYGCYSNADCAPGFSCGGDGICYEATPLCRSDRDCDLGFTARNTKFTRSTRALP